MISYFGSITISLIYQDFYWADFETYSRLIWSPLSSAFQGYVILFSSCCQFFHTSHFNIVVVDAVLKLISANVLFILENGWNLAICIRDYSLDGKKRFLFRYHTDRFNTSRRYMWPAQLQRIPEQHRQLATENETLEPSNWITILGKMHSKSVENIINNKSYFLPKNFYVVTCLEKLT